MHGSLSPQAEPQLSASSGSKRGGWITFPFITAGMVGVTLAAGGCMANMVVYLISEFHVKSIDAAQILNIFGGCTSLVPVVGAGIADSLLGCFSVILISSFICLAGVITLSLTATIDTLQPGSSINESGLYPDSTKFQLAILYAGIALTSIGVGGMRFTIATMGANQFNNPKDRGIFFNWYLIILYTSVVVSGTIIVYIEDNVGWAWGFGLCIVANVIGIAIFVLGNRYYHHVKPQGSPFTSLARVVVATIRKKNALASLKAEDYYHAQDEAIELIPTKSFRFLNRAALKVEGDLGPDGSITKPWSLCSIQQVEDLKTLIRILPLCSTGIFLSTPLRFLSSVIVLQALTMDRQVGSRFKIPAGSMPVFVLASTAISLTIIDRFVYPIWQRLIRGPPPVLHRIAAGHVFTVAGIGIAAVVESNRLKLAQKLHDGATVSMPVAWLGIPLAAVGIGEAFHYPGQVAFYYQEFPPALRSTATAMIAMHLGIAYYISSAMIDLVQRVTRWLPNDINDGRLDYVYWILASLGVLNFCYFLVCAGMYKNQAVSGKQNTTLEQTLCASKIEGASRLENRPPLCTTESPLKGGFDKV